MNIKPLYLIIAFAILIIGLGFSIWGLLDTQEQLEAEKAARETLEEKLIDTEAEKNRLRDSVQLSIRDERKERQDYEKRLDSFENIKPTPRYDKSIDTIRNSNRIDSLFSRYYR